MHLQKELEEINSFDISSRDKDSYANVCMARLNEARERII
jgi:hypothetical protein